MMSFQYEIRPAKWFVAIMMVGMVLSANTLPVGAEVYERTYNVKTHHYVYVKKPTLGEKIRHIAQKPVVKKAAIGTAAGAGVALLAHQSLLKGSLVGAAAGVGMHLIDKNQILQHEPLARQALKGGVIGTGVGIAAGTALLPAAAIGVGIGAGVHYARKYILESPE